jgi:hypothetical protein
MTCKRIATPDERPSSKEQGSALVPGWFRGASMEVPQGVEPSGIHAGEQIDESRKIRRLQMMISMVMSVISQDPDLTVEEAADMAANARRAALAMFPGKELAYDILYKPRLQRLMNERFRLQ